MGGNVRLAALLGVVVGLQLSSPALSAEPGTYSGSIKCSWGSGSLKIQIAPDGTVSGGVTNGKIKSGRASGRSINFTTGNFMGGVATFTGVISGDDMSGTYSQNVSGETCTWSASYSAGVRTSQSANPGKDPEPDYSKMDAKKKRAALERDAQSFLTAGRAAASVCSYADQMVAAGRFSQAAESFRLMDDGRRQKIAQKYADAASKRADECAARAKSKKAPKQKAAKSKEEAGKKTPTIRECLRQKIQLDALSKRADDDKERAIVAKARKELKRAGCKV